MALNFRILGLASIILFPLMTPHAFADQGAVVLPADECNISNATGQNGATCTGAVVEQSGLNIPNGTVMDGVRSDVGLAIMPIIAPINGSNLCQYVDNYSTGVEGTSVFVPFKALEPDWAAFINNAPTKVGNVSIELVDCTLPFGSPTYTVPAPAGYGGCSYFNVNQTTVDAPPIYQRYYKTGQPHYVAPPNWPSAGGEPGPEFVCESGNTDVYSNVTWAGFDSGPWVPNRTYGPDITLKATPNPVGSGSPVTLTWSVITPAATCVGNSSDQAWNNTPLSVSGGQTSFTPSINNSPVQYSVTCADPLKITTSVASVAVTVQTPLSVAITSDTKSVTSGNPAHLSWVVTNSTAPLNCIPSSSDGSWPPSPPITVTSGGPIAITPTAPVGSNATYSLSCTDSIQNTPVKSNVINVAVTAADCLAENGLTWGQGSPSGSCTGNLGAGTLGSSPEIINTAANFTGTEIATCNAGGVWSFSGQTCNASGGVGGGSTCAAATTGFTGSCGYTIGQGDACNFGGYVGSSAYQDIMNADNAVGINSSTDGTLGAVIPYIWSGIACSLPDDNDQAVCNDFKHNPNGASFIYPEMANDGTPVGTSGTVAGSITDGNGTVLSTYGIVNWSWSIRFCTNDEHGHESCGPISVKISRVCPDCTPPVPLKYDSCYNTYNGYACKKSQDGLMCDYFTSYCDKAGVLEELSITYWNTADGPPPCGAFKGFGK